MKRTAPLRQRKPLRRRAPMRRARRSTRYARRERDTDYMAVVRRLPCAVRSAPPDPARITRCSGPVEADHMGARGLGQKADDRTCVPMCRQHHRERTDHSGAFRDLNRDQVREWRAGAMVHAAAQVAALEHLIRSRLVAP